MELIIFFSAIVLVAVLIALPFLLLRRKMIKSFANQWAKENGFELVKCEEKSSSPLAFSLTSALSQDVVLAVVKDSQGKSERYWLKIEGFFTDRGIEVECKLIK